jgi:hypothetical protein
MFGIELAWRTTDHLMLEDIASLGASPPLVMGAIVLAGILVGAGAGCLAGHIRGGALRRRAYLALMVVPALYATTVVALTIIWVPEIVRDDLGLLPQVLVNVLLFSGLGLLLVFPIGVLPATAAALILERWTRAPAPPARSGRIRSMRPT